MKHNYCDGRTHSLTQASWQSSDIQKIFLKLSPLESCDERCRFSSSKKAVLSSHRNCRNWRRWKLLTQGASIKMQRWSIVYFQGSTVNLNVRFSNWITSIRDSCFSSLHQKQSYSLVYLLKIVYDCLKMKIPGLIPVLCYSSIIVLTCKWLWLTLE